MHTVEMKDDQGGVFVRVVESGDGAADFRALAALSELRRKVEEDMGGCVAWCRVMGQSRVRGGKAKGLYFSNICGKVQHWDCVQALRAEVLPFSHYVHNDFGSFVCLFSVACNLHTSTAMTTTLFRGATSTRDASAVIEHGLRADAIRRVTVHMMVCSCHLAHPVSMQSGALLRGLADVGLWRAARQTVPEEMQYMHSFKLTGFDAAALGSGMAPPKSMLVNVSRTGAVNMFLSTAADTLFEVDMEHAYLPLYTRVFEVLERFT